METHNEPKGLRFDDGKPKFRWIPTATLVYLSAVLEKGTQKYVPWNWAKGMDAETIAQCIMRHTMRLCMESEWTDQESGLPHAAHIMANCMMLLELNLADRLTGWPLNRPGDLAGMDAAVKDCEQDTHTPNQEP